MKHKTSRRKKTERTNDLVSTTLHNNSYCPSCRKLKNTVIHFIHKDVLHNKRRIELLLCENCIDDYKQQIIRDKNKNLFSFIPILNTMLKAVGKFEEKSLEQLESEFEILPEEIKEGEIVSENTQSIS
jgi:protein-arginine kinase activator protein McsA